MGIIPSDLLVTENKINTKECNLYGCALFFVQKGYKSAKITYAEAEFNARNRIYQSVNPNFNPDVEYIKDPLSRDILSVDNSLLIIARKLLLDSKA